MKYWVEPGSSSAIRFPQQGPFDERLGYTRIPAFTERLVKKGFRVGAQAHQSDEFVRLVERGYFPPYREKIQAGMSLRDCRGESLFAAAYPERVYGAFDEVPRTLLEALLFIENRELLDEADRNRNPAVEWDRLAKAVLSRAMKMVVPDYDAPGGSTLATQIEKYRHSPDGITSSGREKFRQMWSASLRAYMRGADTVEHRRQLVVDYLNTVPLSASPGFGEVNGVGDGLWAYFGVDFAAANIALSGDSLDPAALAAKGLALRQALSLMVAQRRPSYYLGGGYEDLQALTESYLRLLDRAGIISPELRAAAIAHKPKLAVRTAASNGGDSVTHKAANAIRARVAGLLEIPRLYDLDRLDLAVETGVDGALQRQVSELIQQLQNPEVAKEAGLLGHRLLERGDPAGVQYSFVLFERTATANWLRVQTDSYAQPFDINDGAKLELGSTAKLRTLVTYLQIVAELHSHLVTLNPEALRATTADPKDHLTRWARDYLVSAPDRSLAAMLAAAMERRYSASPGEGFFTGGGMHTFANFKHEDDNKQPTVREALRDSVNLAFIRIMRDVVYHYMYGEPGITSQMLSDVKHPQRAEWLARFADHEGKQFLQRFYRKYRGKTADEAMEVLLAGIRPTPQRLAVIFRSIEPQGTVAAYRAFLQANLDKDLPSESVLHAVFERHAPGKFDLMDRGYLARVHPLELWVVGYLHRHPGAGLGEVIAASAKERQEVYGWLFKAHKKNAQDVRIRMMLEAEAFLDIHRAWKRLGYPFDYLVPSYASAIGSSGDRPAALAELMGIIVNDGLRLPTVRVAHLRFAADTPYETALAQQLVAAERVMPAQVAATVRDALANVVSSGTARRLAGALDEPGRPIVIGGKTGTGDNRAESYGAGGKLQGSRVLNRTATFAFYLGDRYFGVMTAFVPGVDAGGYHFTSALPVQIVKHLAPVLRPVVHGAVACSPDTLLAAPGITASAERAAATPAQRP